MIFLKKLFPFYLFLFFLLNGEESIHFPNSKKFHLVIYQNVTWDGSNEDKIRSVGPGPDTDVTQHILQAPVSNADLPQNLSPITTVKAACQKPPLSNEQIISPMTGDKMLRKLFFGVGILFFSYMWYLSFSRKELVRSIMSLFTGS